MRIAIVVLVVACSSPSPRSPVPPPPAPASIPAPAADPLNFDFEVIDGELPKGWHLGGRKDVGQYFKATVDHDAHHGATSLKIASIADGGDFLPAIISTDGVPYRGKHVRLHGWIRTDNVAGVGAALWVRGDGSDGRMHGFDNMEDRAVTGTSAWHEVIAETDLDAGTDRLVLGVMLVGTGSAWFDSLSLETTSIEPPKPVEVSGRVVDAAGNPVAGATVALIGAKDQPHATTDASGTFRFETKSGRLSISAHHPPSVGACVENLDLTKDTAGIEIKLGDRDGTTMHVKVVTRGPIPPETFLRVSELSDHSGDIWMLPIAADGTATAIVPHAGNYVLQIDDHLLATKNITSDKTTIDTKLEATTLAPPPEAVTTYLRDHATPLATPEAGNGFADMAAIGAMVGNAHVVGLGEATHGTREFFQLKHRFFEYLVAEKGFTVFAIEANQPECRAINDYIRDGKGDAKTALDGIYFWTWNTEEVLAMIEWMRTWNQDPKHIHKLEFTGFDMQASPVAYGTVADFVTKVDPERATALVAPIKMLGTAASTQLFAKASPDERRAMTDALVALAKSLDEHAQDYVKRASAEELATARHDLTILQQWVRMNGGAGSSSQIAVRDESMADNIVWLRGRHAATTKMVVWAHNAHVSRDPKWMGSHLATKLGTDYMNFGFIFGDGSFQAMSGRGGLGEDTLPPAPETDISAPFTRTGKPILVVDLRKLPAAVASWFGEVHPMRETGAVFFDEKSMTTPHQVTKLFDALIFVAHTTRARPVKHD